MTDLALDVAGALAVAVGAAHSYLGERYILVRLLRRPDLPRLFGSDLFTRRTLRFAWHLTTLAWWGFAALLVLAARSAGPVPRAALGSIVAGTFLASALMTLMGSRGRHLAWLVFLGIAIGAWVGLR